jgi:hypothetical protein
MPIVQLSHADSRAEYDAVTQLLDFSANRPAGLILHAASETPTGTVEIVDVWASAEHAAAFEREHLFPAFEATGLMAQIGARPQPVAYEPFDYVA